MLSFELCWMVSILNQQIYIHNIHLYPRYQDFLATSSVKKNCMRVEIPFFLICYSFLRFSCQFSIKVPLLSLTACIHIGIRMIELETSERPAKIWKVFPDYLLDTRQSNYETIDYKTIIPFHYFSQFIHFFTQNLVQIFRLLRNRW